MIFLIKLFLAHLIGDYLLQPKSWVIQKEEKKALSPWLYLHILIHGLLVLVLLWDFKYWLLALLLMLTHGVIDLIKLYLQNDKTKTSWFFADQITHIFSILVFWFFWFDPELPIEAWTRNPNIWIYITAILFLTVVTGILIQVLMANWSKTLSQNEDESLNNAGKYIGILERILVFSFILVGKWEAIGFLIAAKSVFRFGDLKESKDRKLTEYILIGTLLSFGIAIGTGLLVLLLIEKT